jgi:hypothetical protein
MVVSMRTVASRGVEPCEDWKRYVAVTLNAQLLSGGEQISYPFITVSFIHRRAILAEKSTERGLSLLHFRSEVAAGHNAFCAKHGFRA